MGPVFAATLLFALLVGSSGYEWLLRPKILQFFGDISYGLYLIHVLVFMIYRRIVAPGDGLRPIVLEFVICSTIAVGLAALSRFTVEEWFLAQKDRLTPTLLTSGAGHGNVLSQSSRAIIILHQALWKLPSRSSLSVAN